MDDATAGELRSADRALACVAGALLAPRLAATTADFSAGLGFVRSLAGSCELRGHDLVNERDVGRHIEDRGGQFSGSGLLAGCVENVD